MATLEASVSPPVRPSTHVGTSTDGHAGDGESTWTIAQAAQATGVSVHTLRYYERAGLMREPVARAASSHRRYTASDIAWVSFLTRLRLTGMPIREMARYARLARAGAGTETDRLALLTEHRRRVLDRLHEEQRNLAAIDCKIAHYERILR